MDEPDALCERLHALQGEGFRAFKIGWGPFGRHSDALDERIVSAARDTIGTECPADGRRRWQPAVTGLR